MRPSTPEPDHFSHLALQAITAAVVVTDCTPSRRVQYCNPAFAQLTGHDADELHGRPLRSFLDTSGPQDSSRSTLRFVAADGGPDTRNHFHITPVFSHSGEMTNYVWVQLDAASPAAVQVSRDEDTGLPLRAFFMRELENTAVRCQFDMNAAVGVLRWEQMKSTVNLDAEARGEVLRHLVIRLKGCMRTSDVIAVLQPQMFGILLYGVEDEDSLRIVSHRMQLALTEPFRVYGLTVQLQAVFGFLIPEWHAATPEEILRQVQGRLPAARTPAPTPSEAWLRRRTEGPAETIDLDEEPRRPLKPAAVQNVTVKSAGSRVHVSAPGLTLDLSDTEAFFLLLYLQHAPAGRTLRFRDVIVMREGTSASLYKGHLEARVPAQELLVRLNADGFPGASRPLLKRAMLLDPPNIRAEARDGLALLAPGVRLLLDPADARILQIGLLLSSEHSTEIEYHAESHPIARLSYTETTLRLQLPLPHPAEPGAFTWNEATTLRAGQRFSLSEQLLQAANKAAFQAGKPRDERAELRTLK